MEFQERLFKERDPNSSQEQKRHRKKDKSIQPLTSELQEQYFQIESKVNQAIKDISSLQLMVEDMMIELNAVSRNVSDLCSRFTSCQKQLPQQTASARQIRQEVQPSQKTHAGTSQQMYAFSPSSGSPYGFSQDDWSVTDEGQTFVMKIVSSTEAKFTINNKAAAYSQVLNNLAYLDRLIECENIAAEGVIPTRIQSIAIGRLRLQDSVWTIQNRIKIKIY